METNDNIITLDNAKKDKINYSQDLPIDKSEYYNSKDGGNNMNNKYVTHTELELSNEKILHKIDNHFNEQDKHFIKIENALEVQNNKIQDTDRKVNKIYDWIIGGFVLTVLTTIISTIITNLLAK